MTLKKIGTAVALVTGLVFAAGAIAHEMGPMPKTPAGKAAYARHDNFKQVGGTFKTINDELKKDAPDLAVLKPATAKVKDLASKIPSWFPKGSGAESGVKTDAKPDVWNNWAGFTAAANRLQVETSKLQQFAAAGDIAGLKGQTRAVAGACKNCHDNFRVPEKH